MFADTHAYSAVEPPSESMCAATIYLTRVSGISIHILMNQKPCAHGNSNITEQQ